MPLSQMIPPTPYELYIQPSRDIRPKEHAQISGTDKIAHKIYADFAPPFPRENHAKSGHSNLNNALTGACQSGMFLAS